ncbi:MAG TPA: MerR family transcriptional regulator [Candidatus Sulfomarinibacteraceae bacterium]|nr:MerR family transcriptional regulator [Candidatus Sulfomarinibacteraceae bacterium]
MTDSLYIGEIADLFGISTKTLRHYEKLGLLQPRRAENDYRLYGPDDVRQLQRIRQLQSLGLSLQEIRRMLDSQDDEELWDRVLRRLHREVEEEIAALNTRLDHLEDLLAQEKPPAVEDPAHVPERVNEYLEQHLPQASLARWRQERAMYALLSRLLHGSGRASFPGPNNGFRTVLTGASNPGQWNYSTRPEAYETYYTGVRNVLGALQAAASEEEDGS